MECTIFKEACSNGQLDILSSLLPKNKYDEKMLNLGLTIACMKNQIKAAEMLLKNGVNQNDFSDKMFYDICKNGFIDIVKLLDNHFKFTTRIYFMAAVTAIQNKHINLCKFFVDKGIDLNCNDGYIFITACAIGNLNFVKYLVQKGANVHVSNNYSIVAASISKNIKITQYLISNGVPPNGSYGYALVRACENGADNIVKLLISVGCDPFIEYGICLTMACKNGHINVVRTLLPYYQNKYDYINSALISATENGDKIDISSRK